VHLSGPITELTTLRLKDLEDRGVGSIAVVKTTTTDASGEGDGPTVRIVHWSAVADAASERVETHGASAEEAAKTLADVLEELMGAPLSDDDVETADAQLQQITDRFAERGFTLVVHAVEPNVWHADWSPRAQGLGAGRTASGLSPLRAARQALADL
jgi:hypothetical protein